MQHHIVTAISTMVADGGATTPREDRNATKLSKAGRR
jgi:hypothetical protein